jgi:fructose-specific phosphotransferase system IIC component
MPTGVRRWQDQIRSSVNAGSHPEAVAFVSILQRDGAGSVAAGTISMAFNVELELPHVGVSVLPIPGAVTHLADYLAALIAGTVLSALLPGLLKWPWHALMGAELAATSTHRARSLVPRRRTAS